MKGLMILLGLLTMVESCALLVAFMVGYIAPLTAAVILSFNAVLMVSYVWIDTREAISDE